MPQLYMKYLINRLQQCHAGEHSPLRQIFLIENRIVIFISIRLRAFQLKNIQNMAS